MGVSLYTHIEFHINNNYQIITRTLFLNTIFHYKKARLLAKKAVLNTDKVQNELEGLPVPESKKVLRIMVSYLLAKD